MVGIDPNILIKPPEGKRPYSISVEDVFFGDSGKGRVVAEFNRLLSKKKKLISVRYNGGANAGHEVHINGKQLVTHQLPMAVVEESATALMLRGMVIHPQDLVTEIDEVSAKFSGKLPGMLKIDRFTPLCLDTHRALEFVLNAHTNGGKGSTGRGIATAYASVYLRVPILVGDLFKEDWEDRLKDHYKLYGKMAAGFGDEYELKNVPVKRLNSETHVVGSEEKFIKELGEVREKLRVYVEDDMYGLLTRTWADPKFAFTFEGAQGAGLDPYHGVYPDVTSSRPMSRFINDSTYNICQPEEIALRVAVMKTTYMSSVGTRRLPTIKDENLERWIQEEFDERGRSTGRLRDIYPVSIPIATYLRAAAGYEYLAATHLDASKGEKIKVITSYSKKHETGGKGYEKMGYLPYQEYLDNLEAETREFRGWDGQVTKGTEKMEDLPKEALNYLEFLSQNIAPVIFATSGPELGKNYLSQIKI